MKYCYRCGMPYEGIECQSCHSTIYTEHPNQRTLDGMKKHKLELRLFELELMLKVVECDDPNFQELVTEKRNIEEELESRI